MTRFDVVVVGLGAAGSAALYHLARRGVRVAGVDRHAPPHTLGSSHGRTRIIREAYYEHPLYVPFVRRAYEWWAELEAEWDRGPLLVRTGGLMIGPASGTLVSGASRSAREHGIAHELLDAHELRARFPAFTPPDEHVALFEARAGILLPERCIEAHLALAARRGATVRTDTAVTRLRVEGDGVRVETSGETLLADRVVLAAGPWLPRLLAANDLVLAVPLAVERQLSHWFAPRVASPALAPDACPIALWEHEPGRLFAAFPDLGDGVKCGAHHDGDLVQDPERVNREVSPDEAERAREILAALLPSAAGESREHRVCLYTNTPDAHFVIDRHPRHERVILASACSGHGFKFSSATGELLADLATDVAPGLDLAPFSATRFTEAG